VLSDSLQAASAARRARSSRQRGRKTRGSGADIAVSIVQQATLDGPAAQNARAIQVAIGSAGGRKTSSQILSDGSSCARRHWPDLD